MRLGLTIRNGVGAAGLLVCAAGWLQAQQPDKPAKPSAAVSTLPAAQRTTATAGTATAPALEPAHHVAVSYADGKLGVEASNAGLDEILREVSQKTGMKITGGVEDDRVFGSYGPAAPAAVLDALLDGTGSNIVLLNDVKGGMELILTPRHGGATPPNPNAERQANEAEESVGGGYVPPVRPYQPPQATGRGQFLPGADSQLMPPGGGTGAPPGSEPGSDQAPTNGTKTPQEIYEQLQQTMQQQRRLNAPQQ